MNKEAFDRAVADATSPTWQVDAAFMAKWFEWTLKRLEAEGAQSKTIGHPTKTGDQCEAVLREVLRALVPGSISLGSGFLATDRGTVSKEQDIILLDPDKAMNLRPGGRAVHFPLECCLASIEVKSELNVVGMRRAILNCLSVKTLYWQKDFKSGEKPNVPYCYGIFAYRSPHSIEATAARMNDMLCEVPHHLRPNVIYVLGKGLLLPGKNAAPTFEPKQLLAEDDFLPVKEMSVLGLTTWKEVYPFLWFISSIVDYCLAEKRVREMPNCTLYWLTTFALQSGLQKARQEGRV